MDIVTKTYTELVELLKTKKLSTKEINDAFAVRIQKYNDELNVFLTVEDKPEGGKMPMAYKDNFCTQGVRTTASSKVLDQFIPPYSATVVTKMANAGTYVLGKTNMDAWAHGSSTETSDYGPTKNPWDTKRAAGGSSGGSAAAVSAYLAPVAIGSETAGSIRQPAAWCGVVGLKPTYGRVSRYGVIAMGSSFDCPGPITRTVEDAAHILTHIAGKDRFDATSSEEQVPEYQKALRTKKPFTIGIPEAYFEGVDEETKEKVNEAIKILEKQGHELKRVELISPKYAISVYTILQRAEVSSNLARYDGVRYGNDRTNFGEEAKRRIMLGTYTLSHGYYDAYYKKAQKVRALVIADFKKVFKDVDLIVAPTAPTPAITLGEFEKYPFFGEMMDVLNEPAAVAGIPAINIPVGTSKGNLPIGLQLMGPHFGEENILNAAHFFEKETDLFGVTKQMLKKYE